MGRLFDFKRIRDRVLDFKYLHTPSLLFVHLKVQVKSVIAHSNFILRILHCGTALCCIAFLHFCVPHSEGNMRSAWC